MPAYHPSDTVRSSLKGLRRFTSKQKPAVQSPGERCELCGVALASEHRHLLNLSNRAILCSCQACSILFNARGSGSGQYRLIPERYVALPDFRMTDEQWEALMLPVNVVYLFQNSVEQRLMAFYPSPAGATESLLSLENWEELVGNNPVLQELEPDVEALLINRVRDRHEYYIVPLDACYRLVGLIRMRWRGLSGGEEVWSEIARFFAEMNRRASEQMSVKGGSDAGSEL
ncbi:DUF5947 family protein [Reticulibacter mediterranei]|uniref:DUF5947 family protein n=1 Tax=Reticulibacter mediterranei TaxID=2778369 RepID=UPI001C68D82B|nr:DUF5947 family protein [Reticulibacter mediterranei]